jgi:TonB-dependent starch-binding outer membrane protein SusC
MKKIFIVSGSGSMNLCSRQILRKMKLTYLLLFITVFNLTAGNETYSQYVKLNLDMKNVPLQQVLNKIEEQSEFFFLYSSKMIDVNQMVNINAKDQTIDKVLNNLLSPTEIKYSVKDRQILLINKEFSKDPSYQQKTVSGKIVDNDGNPVPGVTILLKGTTIGTVSDASGNYSISNVPPDAILVFSFVGMTSQEVPVKNQAMVNVTLEEEAVGLEEVVVIGYGKQKKVNLTGAVSYVTAKDLEKRTVINTSTILQGQLSGISVRQTSGNPASGSASLLIRGQGTFSSAGNSPLVLVDGIESSIDNVDPHDVASVSILKDAASSAIYGSKAANGVILVTTKTGQIGAPVISINTYVGQQRPTMIPEMVDSWEYATAYNEALRNSGSTARWTEAEIQKFKDGSDPVNYPNFNHMNYIWDSGTGLESKHNINVTGGTPGIQYMFSGGYYNQQGLVMKNESGRWDVRLNLDAKLRDNLKLMVKMYGDTYRGLEPSSSSGSGLSQIIKGTLRLPNTIAGPTPDGYFPYLESIHPEADLHSKSFIQNGSSFFSGNGSLVWDVSKDFKITGQAGINYSLARNKNYIASYTVTPTFSNNLNSLRATWSDGYALTLQSMAEYNKSLGSHNIHLLAGVSGQTYMSNYISAYRDQFPNNEIYEIDAGATARGTNSGTASRNRLASLFGRLNYNFSEKYLFELNFRYDGSSRFPEDRRWGFFPSASMAWRISEEDFFKNSVSFINNLKLRGSWGQLGNQSVGNYPYQYLISLGQNYPSGSTYAAGAAINSVSNKLISWETTKVTDVGVDLAIMENKLSLSADYFIKKTVDILYNISVSRMLGASPAATNAGTVENRGWDFDLSYRNQFGDFNFGASAIFSVVNNKVLKLANLSKDISRGLFVGHPIGSVYGYVSDGIFSTQAEVDAAPTQPFSFLAQPGEIRFRDISGPDGKPDGLVTSTYDRTIIGNPLPTTTYGLTLTAGYKNFDFNILFQGEGGRKDQCNLNHWWAIDNLSNVQRTIYENRWTEANPDPNAMFPKIRIYPVDFWMTNKVDYFMKSGTFIRLKNTQLGYNLPESLLNKTFMRKVRVYVAGENLLTLSKFYKGWDPEMSTSGTWYPLTKLYVAGLNISF